MARHLFYLNLFEKTFYFCTMNFSSKLLESAVDAFSSLPGIGKKTALRLALHTLKQGPAFAEEFTGAVLTMSKNINNCKNCHNLSDETICSICQDKKRDDSVICVVESIRDVMAIEDTNQFKGKYHILGGTISPLEGIGPEMLNIDSLLERAKNPETKEVIMAISPTIEGETTIYFISKQLKKLDIKVSTIARGVSFGGNLEYADEMTLGRSIVARIPYQIKSE